MSRAAPTDSETEFLAQQAAEARAAMGATLGDLGQTLNQSLRAATDVRGFVGLHPWWALGAAAAAGFAGGMALAPGSRQRSPASHSAVDAPEFYAEEKPARRSRIAGLASLIPWEMLLGPITELVRTLVENLFAAIVASRAAAQAAAAATPSASSSNSNRPRATSPESNSPDPGSPLDDPLVEQATEA
ncbi:MAG TPA: hypothetical protein VHY20_11990 [Pirellulales bacterium]|nr:hypothetical protein [Pirellulales bacterium]